MLRPHPQAVTAAERLYLIDDIRLHLIIDRNCEVYLAMFLFGCSFIFCQVTDWQAVLLQRQCLSVSGAETVVILVVLGEVAVPESGETLGSGLSGRGTYNLSCSASYSACPPRVAQCLLSKCSPIEGLKRAVVASSSLWSSTAVDRRARVPDNHFPLTHPLIKID